MRGHDNCRNTHSFKHAGQNLGQFATKRKARLSPFFFQQNPDKLIGVDGRYVDKGDGRYEDEEDTEDTEDNEANITDAIQMIIDQWFIENAICNSSIIKSFQPEAKTVGHFLQMVRDDASHVGCAGIRKRWKRNLEITYLVCDYSATVNSGKPIYEIGPLCSKCTTGTCGPDYPGLCEIRIDYCDESLCLGEAGPHVACNKSSKGLGPECGNNATEIVMTPQLQTFIVSLHNKVRSKVAMGKVQHFKSAASMLEMVGIYISEILFVF